jgi:GGDEF domain-containing protein
VNSFLKTFLFLFAFRTWAQPAAEPVFLPADVHGGSALCREARVNGITPACDPGDKQFSTLRLQGTQWVRVASERDIKRKLFLQLGPSYQFDADLIRQVGQTKIFESEYVKRSMQKARAKCTAAAADGTLRDGFEHLIAIAQKPGETAKAFAEMKSDQKESMISRYALAHLEIKRLGRLINDNHVTGANRERVKRRKAELELRYPMAQSIGDFNLKTKFMAIEGINNLFLLRISPEEETAIDVILGLKDISHYPDLEKFKENRQLSLSGALADRIANGKAFSPRMRAELNRGWEMAFARKIEALGELCDISHCQAYEISHKVTADLLNETPPEERKSLFGTICHCNLSNATEILSAETRIGMGAAVIGGITACLATNVACPALATVALVSTAVAAADSVTNLRDGLRAEEALSLSRSLPGIPRAEQARLEDFGRKSALTGLAEAALVAVSAGTTNLRAAFNPVRATKVEIAAGQWQKEFLLKYPQYEDLPKGEIDRIAKEVVEKGEGFVKEVLKANDVSVKAYVNNGGETVLKYSEPATMAGVRGARTETVLAVDSKTGAIDVAFPGGQRLVNAIFNNNENGVIVIFKDLNHLGQTNYFYHGQAAGDLYIKAFGAAVRQNLRPGDLMLKTGGDEIVSVIPITTKTMENPETVKAITQRMVDTLHNSRDAREVFKTQSKILADEFKAVANAEKIADLPVQTRTGLSADQMKLATENFAKFRVEFLNKQLQLLKDHSKYKPSLSIGSVIVKPGGSYEAAKQAAERQAAMVKVEYKAATGATPEELAKYRMQVQATGRREGEIVKPKPMDPIIMEGNPGNPGP